MAAKHEYNKLSLVHLPRKEVHSEKRIPSILTRTIAVLFVFALLALVSIGSEGVPQLRNSRDLTKSPCKKRVVGYYSEWEGTEITRSQLGKLTHAVFAFIHMDSEGKLQFKTNQKERFEKLKTAVKNANSDTKVMISIGGDHNSENFGSVLSDSEKKSMFIDSIARFIRQHKIHGVDIYWKWLGNSETEHHDFPSFLKDLKEKLKTVRDDSIISIVAPQAKMDRRHDGYKFDDFMEYIDFVNVFSMDYYGPWPNQWGTPTGPSAPLYGGIGVKKHFNVDSTMKYYTCMTEDPSKFNMVIPFYVRLWKNVKEPISSGTEVFRRADLKNGAAVGNSYMSRWTVDHEGWELTPALWDDVTKTPYVWNQETGNFLTFENKKSIEAKLAYAIEHNLGGVWIHLVDKDNENEELLRAVASKNFVHQKVKIK